MQKLLLLIDNHQAAAGGFSDNIKSTSACTHAVQCQNRPSLQHMITYLAQQLKNLRPHLWRHCLPGRSWERSRSGWHGKHGYDTMLRRVNRRGSLALNKGTQSQTEAWENAWLANGFCSEPHALQWLLASLERLHCPEDGLYLMGGQLQKL